MAGRDVRHAHSSAHSRARSRAGTPRDRWLHRLPAVLVVLVLLAAGATDVLDLDARLGWGTAGPTGPAAVPPPAGLDLPDPQQPSPVAAALDEAGALDAKAVRRALRPTLRDRHLGRHVLAVVHGLGDADPVLVRGDGRGTPASTMKLLTSTAALEAMGPEHTFTTRTVLGHGGRVVLVGGGDPFLSRQPDRGDPEAYPHRADVVTLARATARALRHEGRRTVRVGYDATLFRGPAVDPHWPDTYVPEGVVAPISALWVDEGRPAGGYGRVADPARDAADAFTQALRKAGVKVRGEPRPQRAGATDVPLAEVDSPPLSQIVERVLLVSDNEGAEVLSRQVGLATGGQGSFVDGAAGVEQVLDSLGVPLAGSRIRDGSGLSREDRLRPETLAAVLAVAADPDRPELRAVVTGLPVAGFSGSLASRFDRGAPQGQGRVRAKTGTLTGVSSLAGIATDLDGDPMVFVLMADRIRPVDTLDARAALDATAAALGACHCAA